MDLTPGSTVCDSRSLSAEAAEYEAQASVAETELRQLDARMKALKEKAEQARLAKQQTEAAREQAFQAERQDRQAAVQESINGHILEGLRRKITDEVDSDLLMGMLERLAARQTAEENEVTWFHRLFMEELTGNDQEFLRDLASRLLRGPEPVAASEKQGPRSQGLSTAPKYHDLATKSSGSTTPAKILAQSPLRHLPISPKTSYNRNESPELGTGENAASSGLFGGDIPESLAPEGGGVAETNFSKGEEIIENIRATNEQDAKEETVFETDNEERDVAGNVDIVPNTITQDVVDLSSDDVAPVPKYDFTMDDQAADTNAGSNEPEQAGDYIAGVEYNTIEQEDVTNASELERSFEAFEWANTLAPVNRRQSTASTDSAFAAPQIPQSATKTLKRAVAGAQKATPISEKPSSKRKRRELEATDSTAASVSTVSIIVRTPANKKAKATDASESTETPSKKGKGNVKEDGSSMLSIPFVSSYTNHDNL